MTNKQRAEQFMNTYMQHWDQSHIDLLEREFDDLSAAIEMDIKIEVASLVIKDLLKQSRSA